MDLKLLETDENKLKQQRFIKTGKNIYERRRVLYFYEGKTRIPLIFLLTKLDLSENSEQPVSIDIIDQNEKPYRPFYNKSYTSKNMVLDKVRMGYQREIEYLLKDKIVYIPKSA